MNSSNVFFSLIYFNGPAVIKLSLLSELSRVGCDIVCCVDYSDWFILVLLQQISLIAKCLVFCFADTVTNALEVYHQIRGLYLMLSWLMLIADFNFYCP